MEKLEDKARLEEVKKIPIGNSRLGRMTSRLGYLINSEKEIKKRLKRFGDNALEKEDFKIALESYKEIMDEKGLKNVENELGAYLIEKKEEFEAHYDKISVNELDSVLDPGAHMRKCVVKHYHDQTREAKKLFVRLIKDYGKENDKEGLKRLGGNALKRKDFGSALDAYEKAEYEKGLKEIGEKNIEREYKERMAEEFGSS